MHYYGCELLSALLDSLLVFDSRFLIIVCLDGWHYKGESVLLPVVVEDREDDAAGALFAE